MPGSSCSVSDIQDYIDCPLILLFILTTTHSKDGCKLDLQTPETIKLFDGSKKLAGKTRNRKIVPSLDVVEVFLVQCNLDNQ